MLYLDLLHRLAEALSRPLPGAAAQARMAPRPRRGWPAGFDVSHRREAAGLLLLFPVDERAHVVLTVRSEHVRHGGQVSLPGGVIEPDETAEDAALREAREEIALETRDVRVLGRLTPIDIPVSGFRLQPVVATIDHRPDLQRADREVARIADVAIATFLDPATMAWRQMIREGETIDVPAFVTDDLVVWGATAMVLAEFLTLIGWPAHHSD